MPKAPSNPFAVKLSPDQRKVLAIWFAEQIREALNVRTTQEAECDYWWQLYEQARTRLGRNTPWPDAADLTSFIPCEKVDAIVARLMEAVASDPMWTVEGWGAASARAPFVEEFHQWKVEEERFLSVLERLAIVAMVEPRGLLEVYEDTTQRTVRKTIHAQIEIDPLTGGWLYEDDGNPKLLTDPKGQFVEAPDETVPAASVTIDSTEPVRLGPQYRVLPYRDSVILPGHAREKQEIWGYGKRFWKRYPEVIADATGPNAIYDKETVDRLTTTTDREPEPALQRSNITIPGQDEITAEKELWELAVLVDLNAVLLSRNGDPIKGLSGARWYVITLQPDFYALLRLEHDDVERSRYVPLVLFPRPDRATEGYSFVGHKLITTTEEHTAWRNMSADRGSMVLQAPIMRRQGALWDPAEQPFGPKAVIDVRDDKELTPFQMPEFGLNYAENRIASCERTGERLAGMNDLAAGINPTQDRTLGENQLATAASAVRTKSILRRLQEAMEDIAQIRHAIWKRTLASTDGIEAPQSLMQGMEGRGVPIQLEDGKITASLLEGSFRFKPHGSVETADPSKRRNDLIGFMEVAQKTPFFIQFLQNPQAQRSLFRELLQAFNVPNRQAFLGSPSQDMAQSQMLGMMPPGMGMPGMGMAPPGLPPGMPPPPMGMPPGMPPLAPSTNTLQ